MSQTTTEIATERLYWDKDRTKLVPFGDPDAVSLAVAPGHPVPAIPDKTVTSNAGVVAMATYGSHPDQVEPILIQPKENPEAEGVHVGGTGAPTNEPLTAPDATLTGTSTEPADKPASGTAARRR